VISGDGQIITSVDRSAFGNVRVPPDRAITRLRFRGQYEDSETGLVYNRFRYYDPQIGRYISPDPQGIWGGLNAFSYANNRPATAIDPDGLAPKKAVVTYNDGTPPDTSFSVGSPDHTATTPASVAKLNNLDNPNFQPSPKQPNYEPHKGQAKRHFHGPNDCAEVGALTEAANKGKLDKIDKIEVTGKNGKGETISAAPCVYCTQRLAEASVQSGVNLFDKVNPGTNKFATNPNDKEAAVIATSQGDSSNMPYEVDLETGEIRNRHKQVMLPGGRGKKS
jgi:RHS repeat-associated protein